MMRHEFRITDAHVHIGRGQIQGDPLMSDISPTHILSLMDDACVARSIIFAPHCPRGYAEANQEVLQHVATYPSRFVGFGRIRSKPVVAGTPSLIRRGARKLSRTAQALGSEFIRTQRTATQSPPNRADDDEQARRWVEHHGLQGIKIHPVQDGLPSHAVLGAIHEARKPLLFHSGLGVDLSVIEREIVKRYGMPIILAHMGGYPAERRLYVDAVSLAQKYRHVYLDTSYVFLQYALDMAVKSCPEQIVFGSDAPGVHPETSVSCILRLRVSDAIKQMVFADNIERILESVPA